MSLAVSALLLLLAFLPQDKRSTKSEVKTAAPETGQADEKQKKKKAKVKPAWPKLKFVHKSIAREKIVQLASKNEKTAQAAKDKLLSLGAGVCPVLLQSLHSRQKEKTRAGLTVLLDELTTNEHWELLSLAYRPKNAVQAHYLLKRLASMEEKRLLPFFKKVSKQESRNKNKDRADMANYALANLGVLDALPFLLMKTREDWEKENMAIRTALPALKGDAATKVLLAELDKDDFGKKLAALRLLHGAGTKAAVSRIAKFLYSEKHGLTIGAVNALRGIVDDDPPYAHLPVFEAIDIVKKWKKRVGR